MEIVIIEDHPEWRRALEHMYRELLGELPGRQTHMVQAFGDPDKAAEYLQFPRHRHKIHLVHLDVNLADCRNAGDREPNHTSYSLLEDIILNPEIQRQVGLVIFSKKNFDDKLPLYLSDDKQLKTMIELDFFLEKKMASESAFLIYSKTVTGFADLNDDACIRQNVKRLKERLSTDVNPESLYRNAKRTTPDLGLVYVLDNTNFPSRKGHLPARSAFYYLRGKEARARWGELLDILSFNQLYSGGADLGNPAFSVESAAPGSMYCPAAVLRAIRSGQRALVRDVLLSTVAQSHGKPVLRPLATQFRRARAQWQLLQDLMCLHLAENEEIEPLLPKDVRVQVFRLNESLNKAVFGSPRGIPGHDYVICRENRYMLWNEPTAAICSEEYARTHFDGWRAPKTPPHLL